MELNINYKISILNEIDSKEEKIVFNQFFYSDSKIIYVINDERKLVGIITIKAFLHCLQNGDKNYINKRYTSLQIKDKKELFFEAANLIKLLHITTAIPVLDKVGGYCMKFFKKSMKNHINI